jgi:hypothetical protein
MKATIVVSIILCLVVGGIAGWALRGARSHPSAASMMNITPAGYYSENRIAILEGKTLTIVNYDFQKDTITQTSVKIK